MKYFAMTTWRNVALRLYVVVVAFTWRWLRKTTAGNVMVPWFSTFPHTGLPQSFYRLRKWALRLQSAGSSLTSDSSTQQKRSVLQKLIPLLHMSKETERRGGSSHPTGLTSKEVSAFFVRSQRAHSHSFMQCRTSERSKRGSDVLLTDIVNMISEGI